MIDSDDRHRADGDPGLSTQRLGVPLSNFPKGETEVTEHTIKSGKTAA